MTDQSNSQTPTNNTVTFKRIFWPSLVAGLVVSIIGLVLWLLVIFGVIGSFGSYETYEIEDNSILHMKLEGEIGESGVTKFNRSTFGISQKLGLAEIMRGLEIAKTDPKVKGIFIELDGVSCGYGTAREIRQAIKDFESSGKFVVAYHSGEVVTQKEYYIASAAKENYGFPSTNMEFLGLGGELTFFKNTLEKLDVEVQIIRGSNNDFKSAVEPFFRDKMSDSSRVQVERYMESIWWNLRKDIANDRKVTPEFLDSLADNMLVTDLNDAVSYKLMDKTMYRDEVLALLSKKVNAENVKDNLTSFEKYARHKFYEDQIVLEDEGGDVAVILAEGGVATDGDGLTSEKICEYFREVRNDEKVKIVVFRINSPGGSALASDEIWREVQLTNAKKKVIVSMGDVAASGGYYIAAPAHRIFADPTTITGSIGVFGMIPYTGKMMENKLGITFDRVSTNEHSVLTTNRKLSEEELALIQANVDEIYTQFKERVAKGRKLTPEQVEVIARGRVWTGEDGKRIGLVDELGGLFEAIAYAKKHSKVSKPTVKYYPEVQEDKLGQLLEMLEGDEESVKVEGTESISEELLRHYMRLRDLENRTGIMMRMEYDIDIR